MTSTDLAPSAPRNASSKPPKRSKPRISKRIRHACELLATGKRVTITDAAKQAKISREHLSRELQKPHIGSFVAEKARAAIRTGALRASHRVLELIDADSEHVSLDAAKHVLAIEGIKPAEERGPLVNVNVTPGYVIKLDRKGDDARDITPADNASEAIEP